MKKSLIIGAGVLFGLTFGGYVGNTFANQPVEAASTKKTAKKIVAKSGDMGLTAYIDIKSAKVQKMTKYNGEQSDVLLVKAKLKNTGKKETSAHISIPFSIRQENQKGVLTSLITSSSTDGLSEQEKALVDNENKTLEPGASLDVLIPIELKGTGNVTIKSSFGGKGTAKINVRSLMK